MADEPISRASFSPFHRWAIGFNVLLSVVALFAIVVMVNYLSSRHHARLHWSEDSRFNLSPLTKRYLEGLTNEVKIVVFYDRGNTDSLAVTIRGLLDEYRSVCRRLDVQEIDYTGQPVKAAEIAQKYQLAATDGSTQVIFDCNGRHKVVTERELTDYDISGALQGEPVKRVAFKGEQLFTQAILSLAEARQPRACYLTGHGEHDLEERDDVRGYESFARLLRGKNIDLRPITLDVQDVPADCQLLVVAGPRRAIPPSELKKIQGYLQNGGRVLILLMNPNQDGVQLSGIERLLTGWNIEVGNDWVVDRAHSQNELRVLLASDFSGHPVVSSLRGSRLDLMMPRSVRERPESARTPDGIKVSPLVRSGPEAQSLITRNSRTTVETNGVIPLSVAVEKGAVAGVTPDPGATRLVVVGDSFFLANGFIDMEANRDFGSLAVNWLLDRTQLLGIGPRPLREYRVNLSQLQMRTVRGVLLGGLPGAVMLLGLLVWARRRK